MENDSKRFLDVLSDSKRVGDFMDNVNDGGITTENIDALLGEPRLPDDYNALFLYTLVRRVETLTRDRLELVLKESMKNSLFVDYLNSDGDGLRIGSPLTFHSKFRKISNDPNIYTIDPNAEEDEVEIKRELFMEFQQRVKSAFEKMDLEYEIVEV